MIRITNLSKIYKSNRLKKSCALNNISLTLPDTGLVFVLGKSGSGKSTFLNLVSGLDSFTSGEIEVDGNVSFENAELMSKAGANIFVAGSSSVFMKGFEIEENIKRLRYAI